MRRHHPYVATVIKLIRIQVKVFVAEDVKVFVFLVQISHGELQRARVVAEVNALLADSVRLDPVLRREVVVVFKHQNVLQQETTEEHEAEQVEGATDDGSRAIRDLSDVHGVLMIFADAAVVRSNALDLLVSLVSTQVGLSSLVI